MSRHYVAKIMGIYVLLALFLALPFLLFDFEMRGYLIMVATITLVGWINFGLHTLVAWRIERERCMR